MKQLISIIAALALLANQLPFGNNNDQNSAIYTSILATSTPLPEQSATTSALFEAYPPPESPTATTTETATPTPEPTVLPTPAPTQDSATEPIVDVGHPQIELSAEPAICIPGKPIRLDWIVLGADKSISSGQAELVIHLPEEVKPQDASQLSLLTDDQTLRIQLPSEANSMSWDASSVTMFPFTLAVDLVINGVIVDSNAVKIGNGTASVSNGVNNSIDSQNGSIKLTIPDASIDEEMSIEIGTPSPNKLPSISLTGSPVEILAVGIDSGKNITRFNQPIELTMRYEKDRVYGGSEDDLQIYYYSESDFEWHPMETIVDTDTQTLTTKTDHLTVFDYMAASWQSYIPPTMDTFQVSDFTGAGTYTLDFPLLPGTAGFTPTVQLTYNSQVVDEGSAYTQASWVGMGWSLDTGSITRNMHETTESTSDDTFLISTNGISGLLLPVAVNENVTTYNTADQSYVKVEFIKNDNLWKAWGKDGTIYTFADRAKTSINSCVTNVSDLSLTWEWALTSITDINGNQINFTYTIENKPYCQNNIAIYPNTILYANGNYQVIFITESRGDYHDTWDDENSRTLYSTKRLKELVLQKKDSGAWTNIRKYVFSYASDTETSNVIFPNLTWRNSYHTSTLISVQEQNGDGNLSLPAASFFYDFDHMHLDRVENGQGGKVEFTYEKESAFDDLNKTRFQMWEFGVTECNPYTYNQTSWTAISGSVTCNNQKLLLANSPVAVHDFPLHLVKPGAEYRFFVQGMSTGSTGTGTYWGFKNATQMIALGLDPARWLYPGPEWSTIEGTLTMPADFNLVDLKLWLENSGSIISDLQVALYITRYRVTSRTFSDEITGKTATYDYSYDNLAYNNAYVSDAVVEFNANGNTSGNALYSKVMGEFRGHSLEQVTNPDGLTTMNWFYQSDYLKGRSYRSLEINQTFGMDTFEGIDTNTWNSVPSGSSTVSKIYGLDLDDSVITTNNNPNWDVSFQRNSASLTDGMSVIAHVRLSESNAQGKVGLTSSSGRFFGILMTPGEGIRQCSDSCSSGDVGATLINAADFKLEKWYVVVLMVDKDDGFKVRVWQLDRPEIYGEASKPGFSPESWRYTQKVSAGKLWLDAYSEGVIFSETETRYTADVQAHKETGDEAKNIQWPYFTAGESFKTYYDLSIFWVRPMESVSRNYGGSAAQNYGDVRWIGTRQSFTYAPKEQYGNLLTTTSDFWDGSGWLPDHATVTDFYPRNDGTKFLVSLPARTFTVACDPVCDFTGQTGLLSETLYLYDTNTSYNVSPNGAGRLTRQRTLVDIQAGQKRYTETGYAYDGTFGNLTSVTTYTDYATTSASPVGPGMTTTRQYDEKFHAYVIAETNPLGHTVSTEYDDSEGLPKKVTDANGAAEGASYDQFGRMTAICEPGDWDGITCGPDHGATLSIAYANYDGQSIPKTPSRILLKQKLDENRWMQFLRYYSGLGELLQTQSLDAELWDGIKNIVVDYQYDGLGRLTRQTMPYAYSGLAAFQPQSFSASQGTVTTSYDILGRPVFVLQADGSTQTNLYSLVNDADVGLALQTELIDDKGNSTFQLFDARGQLVKVVTPTGPGVNYAYDTLGRLTDAYYGNAHTHLAYNHAGQKTGMDDPDMGLWTYGYDYSGNLIVQTDARQHRTCLYYDELNRLIGKNYQTGAVPCPTGVTSGFTVAFSYDNPAVGAGIGRRTGMIDESGSTTWIYDQRGRVVSENKIFRDGEAELGNYAISWTYNSADLATGMTYPNGEYVPFTYLDQGALSSAGSYVISTQYDSAGRVTERSFGNGTKTAQTYYAWNTQGGRLLALQSGTLASFPAAPDLQNLAYSYDTLGNITSILDVQNGGQKQCYSYDALSRLTRAATSNDPANGCGNITDPLPGAYDESYSYDASTGNLASKTGLGELNYADASHAHAVTGLDGATKYTYDANGNMTTRTVGADADTLAYDAENRLVSVTRNGSKTAEYVYDGDGQLALKRDYTVSQTEPDKTLYFGKYFEAFIDADYEPPAGGGTAPDCANLYCIYLPIIIAPPPLPGQVWTMYYYAGGSRAGMQVIDHAGGTSGVYYLYTDHLGSTSVTADETGLSTSALMYKAWGETRASTGDAPTDYGYTGQREDQSINLMWYGSRWYDPYLSRWTSPDSIVPDIYIPQDWDRYAYVRNNPVHYSDPSGHIACGDEMYDPRCDQYDPLGQLANTVTQSSTPAQNTSYIAPPDFGDLTPEGNPLPPSVEGFPDDGWEWGDWPGAGPGYRNKEDPTGSVWKPDKGRTSKRGVEGEDPHWHQKQPYEKGRGNVFPPNPEWGRGTNDRVRPGAYNPATGRYEITVTSATDLSRQAGTVTVISVIGYVGYRIVRLVASPVCGPAAPLCAFGP